jgi:hypothetical protein
MAVNKPVGDNARKGAVKKRSQVKTKLGGVDEAQQKGRRVHGGEKASQEEKGGQEVQGRTAREGVEALITRTDWLRAG